MQCCRADRIHSRKFLKDVKWHHVTVMKQVHTTVPQVSVGSVAGFSTRLNSRKKRLLVSLCSSVRLSACITADTTERIFVKSDTGDLYENVHRLQIWLKSGKARIFLAPAASNHNGHPPPPYRNYVLKQNHIHWIRRYSSQYFKNFWEH
jgi:hypothetical protein